MPLRPRPRRTVIAYWLIPSEPAHSFFQSLISELAWRYEAPVFEPHVTIHVGANRGKAADNAISQTAHKCKPLKLKSRAVEHSPEFIKTVFVEFGLSTELRKLNALLRDGAQDSSLYQLKPHLTLLYKTMELAARRELADSIKVAFSEVAFDSMKAIRCISPTQTRQDVEAWCVVAAAKLSP